MNSFKLVISVFIISNILLLQGCIDEHHIDDKYDLYVGANINNGYSSIQNAINEASNFESIFIYDGIYNEEIIVDKSIKIFGESNDKTIIACKENQSQEISIITISVDNCTINGISINNPYSNNSVIGINIKSSNNSIINNYIYNTDRAVFIDSDYYDSLTNNSIQFNKIYNNEYGLYIEYSNNNNISGNNISNSGQYGIYDQNSNYNIFSYNSFYNNNYGLRIKGSRYNEIFNNNIILNKKGLYFCCGARENTVFNNNFIENKDWHANDALGNNWDNGIIGNYWDDYEEKYPDSEKNNGIWNTSYSVYGGSYMDNFPLVNPV